MIYFYNSMAFHFHGYRCGVRPGAEVADLAEIINTLPAVRFKGIQCYQGSVTLSFVLWPCELGVHVVCNVQRVYFWLHFTECSWISSIRCLLFQQILLRTIVAFKLIFYYYMILLTNWFLILNIDDYVIIIYIYI